MTLLNLKDYRRPANIEEAVSALAVQSSEGRTAALAGGTALVAVGGPEVVAVIDLAELDLAYIRADDGRIRIGATTPLQVLVDAPELATAALGVVQQAARLTAGRNLRLAATVGGTLAVAGSEDALAVALLALDAEVVLRAPGERRWPLDDFLVQRERLLADGYLIAEIAIPSQGVGTASAFVRVGRTPADRPIVCAAARLTLADGVCVNPRLALGGVAERPICLPEVEDLVAGKSPGDDLFDAAVRSAMEVVAPPSDYRGSADYRRALAGILMRRVLVQAAALAGTTSVGGLEV
jgi:probable selenate reductase FAD-binding subunit